MPTFGTSPVSPTTSGATTATIFNFGTFPTVSGATLDSISLYITNLEGSTNVRLAVYQGGSSDTNPNGATLIGETAQVNNGGTANAYGTFAISGSPALTSGARTWIVAKAASNDFTWSRSGAGDMGDIVRRNTLTGETGALSTSTAFPSTLDNSGIGTASTTSAYMLYLTYSVSGSVAKSVFPFFLR